MMLTAEMHIIGCLEWTLLLEILIPAPVEVYRIIKPNQLTRNSFPYLKNIYRKSGRVISMRGTFQVQTLLMSIILLNWQFSCRNYWLREGVAGPEVVQMFMLQEISHRK